MGLAHAVHHLIESWNATNKAVTCELLVGELPSKLGEEESLTIYRIVQEALTNVGRHAKAKTVRIMMDYKSDAPAAGSGEKGGKAAIHLFIEDDGIGLPHDVKFGYGFLGMSERVRKLGGRLKVNNGLDGGALIEAFVPVSRASDLAIT
jgi:two-component system sensor histidine kinase UhpB